MNLAEYFASIEKGVKAAEEKIAPIANEVATAIEQQSPVVTAVENVPQIHAALDTIHSKVDSLLNWGNSVNNSINSFSKRIQSIEQKVQQIHDALYPKQG